MPLDEGVTCCAANTCQDVGQHSPEGRGKRRRHHREPVPIGYDVPSHPVWEMSMTTPSGPAHFISKLRWLPGAIMVSRLSF
jgi:hypothetical protein